MKRINTLLLCLALSLLAKAQGWPSDYKGVMLQGFYWDSFVDTQWNNLEKQADELSRYFSLIWIPQSGNCNSTSNVMGYLPVYYFDQNSSFGTAAQLKSMIQTFKSRNTGIIADVVINHRNNIGAGGSWVDFPEETYNGTTYRMTSKDITANDDGGNTRTWGNSHGYTLGNSESYQDWPGCRDLDHSSSNVTTVINAYLNYLLNDLGYTGFRYDMVKGYAPAYTGSYNTASGTQYSVGEYWEGNAATVKNWINGTKMADNIQSAAFDFPFRYTVRDAINNNDWTKLNNASLISDAAYRRYSVTFVENHDTEYRSASSQQDPIRKDTLAANAYMLAMPGTPCVFLKHWQAYKPEIKAMIEARKLAGINNTSTYTQFRTAQAYNSKRVQGANGELLVVVGDAAQVVPASSSYTQILSGHHYRYYLANTMETAWGDVASGEFEQAFSVKLTAVSATAGAQLVYTLNGNNPTPADTKVASGTSITISEDCTLKVGLLVNSAVKGIVSRSYTIKPFRPHTATVYLKDPNWTNVYFYAWGNDGNNTQLLGGWPGTATDIQKKQIDGATWYCHTFDIDKKDYSFNIIFNRGSGQMQTVDIGPINQDSYYEISGTVNGKYTVTNVTPATTGIAPIVAEKAGSANNAWYTLSGQRVEKPAQKGIYIHNGKKMVVR
ncbi:MAG TPA: alpha-amylase family glycosyl hydrolase [Prevotella sp.]